MTAKKALTIGSATIDTIALIDSSLIERMTMLNAGASFLLLQEGSKTEADEISTHVGGGAVNAAVAMRRLGLDVAALVKLGIDARAGVVRNRLEAEGIHSTFVVTDGRLPTGASVLVSSHERNAAIFTFRGANTLLEAEDLKPDAFAVDLVYVSSLSSNSADRFPEIVRLAKASGAMIAVNPGPRQLSARGSAFFGCMGDIDLIAINRSEAEVMVAPLIPSLGEGGDPLPGGELPALATRGLIGGGFRIGLKRFLTGLLSHGPSHVLLTDGGAGAFLATKGRILHCPALQVEVAGTAGAGDAFAATVAQSIAVGIAPEDALRRAAINAASVVGYVDTQSGLLTADEIDRRLASLRQRLPIRAWAI
ncbi:MAG: carbohydrate kinase family protein [Hyphomicrobiaceae bacterium]|nr:MAG: carbohydrate kinase family protein [Hyphomicrobiaceae bacterium]